MELLRLPAIRSFLTFFLCFNPLPAFAQGSDGCAHAELNENGFYYSETDAALAAAGKFSARSRDEGRVFLGAILVAEIYGRKVYRFNVARGKVSHDWIRICFDMPENYQVSAYWHTHADSGNHYFSETDTHMVRETGKALYLAVPDGYLRVFRPQMPDLSPYAASRLGLKRVSGLARGELIRDERGRPVRIQQSGYQQSSYQRM